MAKLAKSSKPSSPKTPAAKSGKAKPDAAALNDVVDAEVVSETAPETAAKPKDADPKTPATDAGASKASSLPKIERVKGDAEPDPKPEAEQADTPTEKPKAAPASQPEPAKGGLFGSVLGGVIAAGIGFGAAMMFFPQGWQAQDNTALTELQSTVAAQGDTAAGIEADLAATKEALNGEIAGLAETDTALTAGLDGLNTRLDALTQGDGTTKLPDDVQILLNAQKEEIAALQATVAGMAEDAKAQMEAAAAQQETAEQAEARVKARGAAQEIRLALLSGEPFAEALDVVAPAVEVPAALSAVAADGAPTSAEVSGAFPAAARAALSKAARAQAGDDTQSRLKLFFQDQLSARSLSPQDGDSADAVLSRAEAAVKAEDYQTALNEITALPESAQAELADWRAQAEARLGAVDAFTAVTDALNSN